MRSKASAIAISATLHALLVEVEQSMVRVVGLLEHRVDLPVVEAPKLILFVEGVRVERLAAPELLHALPDAPAVGPVGLALGQGDGRPEAEVDVGGLRVERVQV